ncbi:hypothetical protein U1Q18_004084 [Sarracenia purpurea var. burkii]
MEDLKKNVARQAEKTKMEGSSSNPNSAFFAGPTSNSMGGHVGAAAAPPHDLDVKVSGLGLHGYTLGYGGGFF